MQKKDNKRTQKTKKRISVIIMLMLLAICLYLISGTYARYTWKGEATGDVTIAKWQVGLGENQTTTADVHLTIKENTDVVEGKIAPSSTATGNLVINPNGSETSIDYKLDIDDSALEAMDINLKVSAIKADGVALTANEDGVYTGTISLKNKSTALTKDDSVEITFEVTWEDDGVNYDSLTVGADGYGTNKDTSAGKSVTDGLTIPVTVSMQQHIS